MSVDGYKKGRVCSASISIERGYRSICGESLPSSSKEMFDTRLFFWFGGVGEDHVASRMCVIIFRRSRVCREDQDLLIWDREFY